MAKLFNIKEDSNPQNKEHQQNESRINARKPITKIISRHFVVELIKKKSR